MTPRPIIPGSNAAFPDGISDPFGLFHHWYALAVERERQPDAMLLATVSHDKQPSARVVLLKGVDARGFLFYTNYESRKGAELAGNPAAALVFWWPNLRRQIRVEGRTMRLSPAESDAYFATRPRGSQLGAHTSQQSTPLTSRAALQAALDAAERRFEGQAVPRPAHWGGYALSPHTVEFWQEGADRLHDRLRFRIDKPRETWQIDRLSP